MPLNTLLSLKTGAVMTSLDYMTNLVWFKLSESNPINGNFTYNHNLTSLRFQENCATEFNRRIVSVKKSTALSVKFEKYSTKP